ncbi:FIST N-terminal domain-containing protein [Breoghania sp.]|uniref:FIST signal transduction protein n=1 Tax=Breoghania sp. TaxID=2065378 RepID=UPI002610FCED|nr:FIST N-terminal domain-containing protein [Breoghania sp.]MDJ0930874.1 FIST N-terminal domain-containing protein [Breoghania sp.]
MRAASIIVDAKSPDSLYSQFRSELDKTDIDADLVFAFYGPDHDGSLIARLAVDRFPDAALIGGSSSGGVMDQHGPHTRQSAGMLLIEDPDGDFRAASQPLGNDPAGAAEAALRTALENAECTGELPELIWTYQAPGQEEDVIAGLKRVVGNRCPLVGGSSADECMEGRWSQISRDGVTQDSVVVCVLFPSKPLGHGFQGGYEPKGHAGPVTRIDGGRVTKVEGPRRSRTILEINGKPAASVYNGWIDGQLSEMLAEGGNVLARTNMAPLSIFAGNEKGVDQFLLVHPQSIRPDGALTTFAEVEEGSEIYCMRGERGTSDPAHRPRFTPDRETDPGSSAGRSPGRLLRRVPHGGQRAHRGSVGLPENGTSRHPDHGLFHLRRTGARPRRQQAWQSDDFSHRVRSLSHAQDPVHQNAARHPAGSSAREHVAVHPGIPGETAVFRPAIALGAG